MRNIQQLSLGSRYTQATLLALAQTPEAEGQKSTISDMNTH